MKWVGIALVISLSTIGQFRSGVLDALARKQLLIVETADWLGFDRPQRELQLEAYTMAQPASTGRGNSAIERLQKSLTPAQLQFLMRFCVRQEGMNSLLDPEIQSRLNITAAQARSLRNAFRQHPSPTNAGPSAVLDIRLLARQLQARINAVQARHDAERQQWSAAKKILDAKQVDVIRDYLSFPLLDPGILQATMRNLITRSDVQDEIGMPGPERRALHDARHHRSPAPGQTRIVDFFAPEKEAIARLRPSQRERLREIALQSNVNLVCSLEIVTLLKISYEQQAEFNLKNDILGMRRSLEVATGMSSRRPIMPAPPGDPNAKATSDKISKETREDAAKATNSVVRFEAARAAIIRSVLTPSQWSKWHALLGKPFPAAIR